MMFQAAAATEDLTATALAADVFLHGGGDGAWVELEHATGAALEVAAPYTRSAEDGTVQYGQLAVGPGTPRLRALPHLGVRRPPELNESAERRRIGRR